MSGELERVPEVRPSEFWGDERESFDRLDGESQIEHGWFMSYARLGRRRSYKEIAQQQEVSRETIQRAASKHGWAVRVRAYDDYEDGRLLAEIQNRQIEVLGGHAEMLKSAREKATAAISLVNPYTMNPRDLPAWIEVIVKAERLTVGLSDAPKKVDISVTGQVDISIAEMSPAERQEMLSALMGEAAKRLAEVSALEATNILEGEIVEDDEGQPG